MLEGVTESKISNCGIVVEKDDRWYVLEAGGPVKETRLADWVRHGVGGKFAAYRLKPVYRRAIPAFIAEAYRYVGLPHDDRLQFDDESIYSSELIYKAFKRSGGQEIGRVVRLDSLDWMPYEDDIRRFEGGALPLDRELITPKHLSEAEQLERVYSNGF
jgi:hypothetical protein